MIVEEHAPTTAGPPVLLAHPTGNQFFRQLAKALAASGRPFEVCTSLDWRANHQATAWLPGKLLAELERRSFSTDLHCPVSTHPWRELGRLFAGRLNLSSLTRHEAGPFSIDAVFQDFDRWVARRVARATGPGIVYAYEDAAEASFSAAERAGWGRVYDLPIAYWQTSRRLLEEEAGRCPDWEPTLGGTRDSAAKLERKTRELAGANLVICPSRFVADSLPAAVREEGRVLIAPFGSPPSAPPPVGRAADQPLRVLFVGSMSQRKGLADLFAAIRLLARKDLELLVMGSLCAPMEFYRRAGIPFRYEAPRPHAEVLALMRTCDVFCLPSIVEGRALVIQEAMSQGLPVIVTPHTGADDLVTDGVNGFVVPIRDPEQLGKRLAWCADQRAILPEMGRAAQEAASRYSWADYGARIVGALGRLGTGSLAAASQWGDAD